MGVCSEFRTGVACFEGRSKVTHVVAYDGIRYPADLVVAGIGAVPNERLAFDAGLECADGILADHCCRTSDPLVLAAGAVTRFAAQFHGTLCGIQGGRLRHSRGGMAAKSWIVSALIPARVARNWWAR